MTVTFRDASGGGPATSWLWGFGDGTTATTRDATHDYTCTVPDFFGFCSYLVEMTATNAAGHTTAYMGVLVEATSSVDFSVSPAVISRGQTVTFTDASTPGGTNFRWDFGDGGTDSGPGGTVTHAFATAGTYSVRLWVTYPDPIGELGPASKTVTVNPGYCTVPSLTNVRFNDANAIWQGAPYNFTGTVKRATGAPSRQLQDHRPVHRGRQRGHGPVLERRLRERPVNRLRMRLPPGARQAAADAASPWLSSRSSCPCSSSSWSPCSTSAAACSPTTR